MQKRLKKYTRDPSTLQAVASRQITETSIALIATIHDYKIAPTSTLVRLVQGHETNLYRQLQQLYHKGLVNRFAFMRGKNPGEFHYYLDNPEALRLLVAHGADPADLDFEEVRRNKEKRYCDVNNPSRSEEMQGRLLFLKHEAMISRFHAILEMACIKSNGHVELTEFRQGPQLWSKVEAPRLVYRSGSWTEINDTEELPHRPDAFFTLSFPSEDSEPLNFFYEADRHRTDTNKYNRKLRAHFHFAVKNKELLRQKYGLNRIRAVLTETVDDEWAERLRYAANHVTVSGPKPSPLFWFTTSRLFTEPSKSDPTLSTYLARPNIVFQPIWASPVDNTLHALIN
jgi:hypothetical protein